MPTENIGEWDKKLAAEKVWRRADELGREESPNPGESEFLVSDTDLDVLVRERVLYQESMEEVSPFSDTEPATKPRVIPLDEIPGCIGSAEAVPPPANWGWTQQDQKTFF